MPNIPPLTPLSTAVPVAPTVRAAPAAAPAPEASVSVDAIPLSPPPEVHSAMAVAAQAHARLAAEGHQLRFAIDPQTSRVVVEVRNTEGDLLYTAPPSKALEVAAGGSV